MLPVSGVVGEGYRSKVIERPVGAIAHCERAVRGQADAAAAHKQALHRPDVQLQQEGDDVVRLVLCVFVCAV